MIFKVAPDRKFPSSCAHPVSSSCLFLGKELLGPVLRWIVQKWHFWMFVKLLKVTFRLMNLLDIQMENTKCKYKYTSYQSTPYCAPCTDPGPARRGCKRKFKLVCRGGKQRKSHSSFPDRLRCLCALGPRPRSLLSSASVLVLNWFKVSRKA